ncbi:MAG: FecR family protein [Chitinophagaceae bacterium]|nr:FecR family protein [Chitinophagaceae bacterium]
MEQERLWILLGRKLAGVATKEELQELELLMLAYGEDAGTMEIIERMWKSRGDETAGEDGDPISDRLEEALGDVFFLRDSEEPVRPVRRSNRRGVFILSGVALGMAGLVYLGFMLASRGSDRAETMNVIFTRRKSHSNLQFPDGTMVVLNENSRISYNADFGKTKREVILEGEAYFNVTGNAGMPLIIHARNVDIRVLGTVLNVKAYPDGRNVETSLIRGRVEVVLRKDPRRRILLRPNEKIDIPTQPAEPEKGAGYSLQDDTPVSAGDVRPGAVQPTNQDNTNLSDSLFYQLQPLKTEKSSKLIPEIAWIYRKLVFNQEPFAAVAEKLERWYDVRMYFEDDDLKKEIFTGSFEKETLEQALNALQFSYPFDFTIKKKEVFIRRK